MLAREGSNESVVSRFWDSVAAAGGQFHNLGSFPVTTPQEFMREGRHVSALQLQLHIGRGMAERVVGRSMTAAAHLAKNAGEGAGS